MLLLLLLLLPLLRLLLMLLLLSPLLLLSLLLLLPLLLLMLLLLLLRRSPSLYMPRRDETVVLPTCLALTSRCPHRAHFCVQVVQDANDPPVLVSAQVFSFLSNTIVYNDTPPGTVVYNITSFDQDVGDIGPSHH